jgi:hypothetical protein
MVALGLPRSLDEATKEGFGMNIRMLRAAAVVAMATVFGLGGAAFAPAAAAATPATGVQATDNMTPYRTMATDALNAFKSGDKAMAKSKARDLEKAWDTQQKDLRSKSPDVWKSVDDSMDAFIKPLMKGPAPDAAKVQAAYDDFISKLDAAAAH